MHLNINKKNGSMKLKKLKLNEISKVRLEEREMCKLLGGGSSACFCGCLYANTGGSSNALNDAANDAHGYKSYDNDVPVTPTPPPNPLIQSSFCGSTIQPEPQSTLCGASQNTCWL